MNTTYNLRNGKTLLVETTGMKGMAGEPMVVTHLTVDGTPVLFKEVRGQMKSNDANELGEHLDDTANYNYESAIDFTI